MTGSTTVEFDEFDRRGRLVSLSSEGAHSLSETGLVEVLPAGRDRWRIIPHGRVGAVHVENLAIRVLPGASLGLTQLFFLLDHAADETFLSSAVSARDDDELWAAIAESLAALATTALTGGLLRGYRREEASLTTVRGRIRIGDQIRRRPGMVMPLEVTYSDYTPNIPENQILRTAAHRLQFLPELSDITRRKLSIISARIADADIIPMGTPIPSWIPTRLNARYVSALRLADRVVRQMSVEVEEGGSATAAFVTEMPGLFERFVDTELSAALNDGHGRVQNNPLVHLDAGPARADHISVRTGLVYEVDHKPVTTFLPTYPTDRRNRAAEHYRLLAACTALGVDYAFLVYPAQRRDAQPQPRKIVHTSISLIEFPIDLSAGPGACRQRILELAAQARTLAGSRVAAAN